VDQRELVEQAMRGDHDAFALLARGAFARLDIPSIFVYGGTIKPGSHAGKDLTIVSVFEALGSYEAGRLPHEELDAIERKAIPGAGGSFFCARPAPACRAAICAATQGLERRAE